MISDYGIKYKSCKCGRKFNLKATKVCPYCGAIEPSEQRAREARTARSIESATRVAARAANLSGDENL